MVTEKTTVRGNRVYKLRPQAKSFTFRKNVEGKDRYFALGPDLREACKVADQIDAFLYFNDYETTVAKFNPNRVVRTDIPTVGDLIQVFEESKDLLDLKPRSVKSYVNAFKRLVRVGSRAKNPLKVSCSASWADIFNSFRRQMLEDKVDEDEILSTKRTCNTVLRNSKAILSDEAMNYYTHWDMTWAVGLRKLKGYKKVAVHYVLPDEDLIVRTHEYLANLKCDLKFTMLALALHAGMRRSEIAHCRRDWFDLSGDDDNSISIKNDRNFTPKTGQGGTTVLKASWAQLIYSRAEGIDYLIEGLDRTKQSSMDDAFEPLLKDLRALGWDRQSPLHECRKLYGAFLASSDSLYKAQKCLRHTSPQITSDSYSDLIVSNKVIELWAA